MSGVTPAAEIGLPVEALAGYAWLLDRRVPRRVRVLALVGSTELRRTLAVLRRWALVDCADEPTEVGAQVARQVDEAAQQAGEGGLFPNATGVRVFRPGAGQ